MKINFAKWIGGGLGFAIGGPIGAVLGFALGSALDASTEEFKIGENPFAPPGSSAAVGDFAASLLVLSAAVMKSDGRTMKSELDFVKKFFVLQFGELQAQHDIVMLREILKQHIPLQEVCMQIRQNMPDSQRLQLLHYLFGISNADGQVHPQELDTIANIATYLGIDTADYISLKAMYYRDAKSDYDILEISPAASDEEVKKAYRRMAVKYHPDKVSDLGEQVQKAAKEKFQKLQDAYENIKKQRGMS